MQNFIFVWANFISMSFKVSILWIFFFQQCKMRIGQTGPYWSWNYGLIFLHLLNRPKPFLCDFKYQESFVVWWAKLTCCLQRFRAWLIFIFVYNINSVYGLWKWFIWSSVLTLVFQIILQEMLLSHYLHLFIWIVLCVMLLYRLEISL
jgi:hypothetical protein